MTDDENYIVSTNNKLNQSSIREYIREYISKPFKDALKLYRKGPKVNRPLYIEYEVDREVLEYSKNEGASYSKCANEALRIFFRLLKCCTESQEDAKLESFLELSQKSQDVQEIKEPSLSEAEREELKQKELEREEKWRKQNLATIVLYVKKNKDKLSQDQLERARRKIRKLAKDEEEAEALIQESGLSEEEVE